MERLIELVGKLQEAFSAVDASSNEIKLPQIVVVGSQSAGKSSMVERIVGHDFLPRGRGIVTRMPLVLHLKLCPEDDRRRESFEGEPEDDFAVFDQEDKNKYYEDFNEVTEKIKQITNRDAGTNKGIINKPIHLSIYSAHVVNLSLVDMPGLTEIAVEDQPADIPQQIERMVRDYIENENSVILSVQPADTDIANSSAMKLAKQIDRNGDRTLAVLTKLDKMERGTDARDVLTGATLPVKLGIVGVVNRSEADRDKPLDQVSADEEAFLATNYPDIAEDHGCNNLKQKLHTLLTNHINKCRPDLSDRVNKKLTEYEEKLASLGKKFDRPQEAAFELTQAFSAMYKERTFNGAIYDEEDEEIDEANMSTAAAISKILHKDLVREFAEIDPMAKCTNEKLRKLVENEIGLKPNFLPSSNIFLDIVRKNVVHFKQPSLRCSERVSEELFKLGQRCNAEGTFERFPKVKAFVLTTLRECLNTQLEEAQRMIKYTTEIHAYHVNTHIPEFEQTYDKLRAAFEEKTLNAKTSAIEDYGDAGKDEEDAVDRATNIIATAVPAYYTALRNNIADMVAKTIIFCLIKEANKTLHTTLSMRLTDGKCCEEMFVESKEVSRKRETYTRKIDALRKARVIVEEMNAAI